MRSRRRERLEALRRLVRENPFLTDGEIAGRLGVSSHTVRYDRLALGIPEVRRRTAEVAYNVHSLTASLWRKKLIGEVIEIEPGMNAMSLLETTKEMDIEDKDMVSGHFIFAQADSLALAVANAPVAMTSLVNLKFKRPVCVGERLLARAEVIRRKESRMVVLVTTRSNAEQVFRGKFVISTLKKAARRAARDM